MNFLCVFAIAAEKKFSIENPSMLVEKANQYIKDGGIYKTEENKQFFEYIPKDLKPDDVYIAGIKYSLSHDCAQLSYYLKTPAKEAKYNFIIIEVDRDGKCSFSGIGDGSNAGIKKKLNLLEEIIGKANQYIIDGNIRKKDFNTCVPIGIIDKEVRKRIPEKIKIRDLVLFNIESSEDNTVVSYCIKSTIYSKARRNVKFNSISVAVDEKGSCKRAGFGNMASCFNKKSPAEIKINLNSDELENIYEAVFRHIFKNAEDWDKKINVRFLDLGYNNPLSDKFFERFKNEKIPVISPFKKCNNYKPDLFDGKYRPDGKDALFYSIGGIKEFDKTHVFVECSVTWAILAARGYIYTLEKKGDKWEVVEVEMGWIS